ncbi:MAG TPA: ATP-binding protein [Vicinamibacteria bacterium]|nr:ATP-binding protein [Vicinamibacteria bacterium]
MKTLRGRMVVTALAASSAALLVVLVLAGPGLRQRALDQARDELLAEARLMARVVEDGLARGAPPEELDPLVDQAASEVRARVTIVALDGRVVADTAVSGPELLALENHKYRPEVQAALATGVGLSMRHSATVDRDLLYAAVPVYHAGKVVGVSRVALSLEAVDDQVGALQRAVGLALLMAFGTTAILSLALSSSLAGPLQEVMDAARRFAAGDLSARTRVRRHDELGELAQILNRSADQLQDRLSEIARDKARQEAILSAMEDGVLVVDHRGTVILANNALRRGLELREPVGRHYVEVVRQREVGEVLEAVLRTGARRAVEVELRHPRRVYAMTGVPFPGAEGAPHGAVLTFHDATERRRLDQVRRDFVANASHELRTPLTSIRGFVEALEDGAALDPPTSQRFLGKIRTHADRMAALVEDLLELSRLESGERPPRWEEVAPAEVVEDVVASFASLAGRKELALRRADHSAPAIVTDADRLRRILENLVENAVKYTPEGGHVEVTSAPGPDGSAVLEVGDDGPGIAAEHLPRIFERFYRVDKARSRELGGTGLGLAIVKHLAEGMGATVRVESAPGKGARFTVTVPSGEEHTRG